MKIMFFLVKRAPASVLIVCIFSILSGISSAALVGLINDSLSDFNEDSVPAVAYFIGLLLGVFMLQMASEYMALRLSLGATEQFRKDLVSKITKSPLRNLEQIGSDRLFASLTRDVAVLVSALSNSPVFVANVSIVLASLVYLAYVSSLLFLYVSCMLVVGVVAYLAIGSKSKSRFLEARNKEDVLFRHFFSITNGVKELKLDSNRCNEFVNDVYQNISSQKGSFVKAHSMYILGGNVNSLFVFAALGVLLFAGPDVSKDVLVSSVIIVLYVMGPLNGAVHMYPLYVEGFASYNMIQRLGHELDEEEVMGSFQSEEAWDSIVLENVGFNYSGESSGVNGFSVGPFNIEISKGNITYIVGGNGSGKTTLVKILAGLYPPNSGHLRIGNVEITNQNRQWYRSMFAAVFSDYCLFDKSTVLKEKLDEAEVLLARFKLSDKVSIDDGMFSTTSLSQGQRKRLALLISILEDKDIYLYDEWAAEQDPLFREFFYTQLLPEMKRNGKTIIVVTHDDRYYQEADAIYKLEYGIVVKDLDQSGFAEVFSRRESDEFLPST